MHFYKKKKRIIQYADGSWMEVHIIIIGFEPMISNLTFKSIQVLQTYVLSKDFSV